MPDYRFCRLSDGQIIATIRALDEASARKMYHVCVLNMRPILPKGTPRPPWYVLSFDPTVVPDDGNFTVIEVEEENRDST